MIFLVLLLLPSISLCFPLSFTQKHRAIRMAACGQTPPIQIECFCGAVIIKVSGPPSIGRSFCHCSICRKLLGAPFSCNGLWPAAAVHLVGGGEDALQSLKTSKRVERMRCKSCGGPAMARLMGGKVIALPLSLFSAEQLREEQWIPQHHLHYESRVIDVNDSVPKYAGAANGPLWEDKSKDSLAGVPVKK
mmetsp:Transcript_58383/g.117256  ORF Transcript_58383/g.117256 Transcript_58383/m.117256 type:complete len:191 (-) Transcript_58383:225-797(-)